MKDIPDEQHPFTWQLSFLAALCHMFRQPIEIALAHRLRKLHINRDPIQTKAGQFINHRIGGLKITLDIHNHQTIDIVHRIEQPPCFI